MMGFGAARLILAFAVALALVGFSVWGGRDAPRMGVKLPGASTAMYSAATASIRGRLKDNLKVSAFHLLL